MRHWGPHAPHTGDSSFYPWIYTVASPIDPHKGLKFRKHDLLNTWEKRESGPACRAQRHRLETPDNTVYFKLANSAKRKGVFGRAMPLFYDARRAHESYNIRFREGYVYSFCI